MTKKTQVEETYWNYRVIKIADKKLKGRSQTYSYGIHEVFYDSDNRPTSWSAEPMTICSDSCEGARDEYEMMSEAFTKKTLEVKRNKLVDANE